MNEAQENLLNLYDVIFWSGSSDGPNGRDAAYLVAAHDYFEAAVLTWCHPIHWNGEGEHPQPDVIQEIAVGVSHPKDQRILRGPTFEHAFGWGCKAWIRDGGTGEWHVQTWCENCKADLTFETSDFCPGCGQAVKLVARTGGQ